METTGTLERWKEEMPTEQEMRPKDKYTIFDRKEKKYRKGIHSELGSCYVGINLERTSVSCRIGC